MKVFITIECKDIKCSVQCSSLEINTAIHPEIILKQMYDEAQNNIINRLKGIEETDDPRN